MASDIGWLRRFKAQFIRPDRSLGGARDREVDLALGHPSADELLQHLVNRHWADYESLFLSLPADERYVLLGFCAQQSMPPDWLDEWVSSSTSFVAGLFHGTAMTYAAWRARGSGRGAEVSVEERQQFEALLEESWKSLMKAHEAAPDEPEPLARLIPVAMGLETGADDIREFISRGMNTGVPHLGAALYAVEALSAKWLGSTEEALAFAREYAEYSARDRVVIVCAHVENWLWEGMQYDDARSEQYFKRPDVQRDLRECWGRESAWAGRTDYFRFHALNYYAFSLLLMQDEELTREALEHLGSGITAKPWVYSSDKPVFVVNTARLHLGLPAI